MINLNDFEGVAGIRWGAWVDPTGRVFRSGQVDPQAEKKISLIEKVLSQAAVKLRSAELYFGKGKVFIRRGPFGLLLLYGDLNTNGSLVDIVLTDHSDETSFDPTQEGHSQSLSRTLDSSTASHSSTGLVHTLSYSADHVPANVLEELLTLYTQYLGPLARKFAAKIATSADLNLTRLPQRDWSRLLNLLSARISDDKKRDTFIDHAVVLKKKF